jgi:hypothetical protein
MIWTFLVFFETVAAISASDASIILATTRPTITQDPWQCVDENIPQYFQVPKPTKSLEQALFSYAVEVRKTCVDDVSTYCPLVQKSNWCAFPTAAPSSLLSEYSSYAKRASIWWASHSSSAVSVAQMCPNKWYNAGHQEVTTFSWFNVTIMHAECYAEAHATSALPTTKSTLAIPGSTTYPQATKTATGKGVWARGEKNTERLMVAGTGLAYAAMNEIW